MKRAVWTSCAVPAEGRVCCSGNGVRRVGDELVVSVNGADCEVVVIAVSSDRTWEAIDVMTFKRRHGGEHQ